MKIPLINNSTTEIIVKGKVKQVILGDLAIRQGATFNLNLKIAGDYSSWIPQAQIRTNYLKSNGLIKAEFTFPTQTFNSLENKTQLTLRLPADVTAALPITTYQGLSNQVPSVTNCLVYDLELTDPNDSTNVLKLIDSSFVQVIPEVTDVPEP